MVEAVSGGRVNLKLVFFQLLLLVLASTISLVFGLGGSEDTSSEQFGFELQSMPSTFNKRSFGLSALYDLTTKSGVHCATWRDSYRNLDDLKGLLFIDSPLKTPADFEYAQILDWVKAGNSLIYLDDFDSQRAKEFLSRLTVSADILDEKKYALFLPATTLPEFAHVQKLNLPQSLRLLGGEVLVKPMAASFIHPSPLTLVNWGHGRILLGAATGIVNNAALSNHDNWDNFQFFLNWFRTANGPIFFDERCHGFSNSPNVFIFLLHRTPGIVALELMIILLIAFTGSCQRFGPITSLSQAREISNVAFIDGLARAYQRMRANLAALEIIGKDTKLKICHALCLSPDSPREEIVQAWSSRNPSTASNLANFLTDYERALAYKKISTWQLQKLIAHCDNLINEVDKGSIKTRLGGTE